jgi:PTS system galactitol-specific IIA component
MDSSNVFQEELVAVGLDESSSKGAIRILGELLLKSGYVTGPYIDAVIEREKEFPTGLPTKPFGVAIPHADCEHVAKTGIAVGLLRKPVEFGVMGTVEETVGVNVIFLMAIREPEGQIKWLQGLAQFLHNQDALIELIAMDNPSGVVEMLRSEVCEIAR